MEILFGKNSGFCFGVKRAVKSAYELSGENNYILGELIHNEIVNEKLRSAGIKTVNSLSDVKFTDKDTVLIRTHGEPKEIFDLLKESGAKIIDCTCPFVEQIHKIVSEHYDKGYQVVIIGNATHPEVKGINGWCNNSALIFEEEFDINSIPSEKICIVVQTTYSEEKFDKIIEKINNTTEKTVDIYKTICYTTKERQREADIISSRCDAVLVIGGVNSNNTKKLFDISKRNCGNVFMISDPKSFDYEKLKKFIKVGVVLGASTPTEQFREVISNMENITEDIVKTEVGADTVEQKTEPTIKTENDTKKAVKKSEFEKAMDNLRETRVWQIGHVVVATISAANDAGLSISVNGTKSDFEIAKEDLICDEYKKEDYAAKVGEKIKVMVVKKNPVKFSEKAMAKILALDAEIKEIEDGKIFECEIESVNKGGLIGKYGNYEVFVPSSQIELYFVKDLNKYVGKKLKLKAEKVESRTKRRQIVASQRVILQAEKDERDAIRLASEKEFFENVQVGDVILGTPVRFTNFGAFVNVNGFDCLAHISDLSWTPIKECGEVLELNKEYEFKVLNIDPETKRVSIGYKQLQPKAWDSVLDKYKVDDVIKGKVVRIVKFGAFIEVEKGIDGLVHVSQITNKWVENPTSELTVGQEVEAKIMSIDPENEKMNLSIKALLPETEAIETAEDNGDKKPSKRKSKKDEVIDNADDLREWKDDADSGASIGDLLK